MTIDYNTWRPVLLEQITFYKPQVILFANTFKYYCKDSCGNNAQPIYKSPEGSVEVWRTDDGTLLLNAYHPNNTTVTRSVYVNEILDAVRKFININVKPLKNI